MDGIISQRISELEAMPIEEARRHLALRCGEVTSELHNKCSAFMAAREASLRDAREAAISDKADEANRIATEANSIARSQAAAAWRAARYAMYAAVVAAIAAAAANSPELLSLILGPP